MVFLRASLLQSIAAARLDLKFSRDDFSVRAERSDDPLFWIRIELPIEAEVVVSDFKTEMLPPSEQLEVLIATLAEAGAPAVDALRFLDIAPGHTPDSPRAVNEIERHRALAAGLASRLSKFVSLANAELRRGKIDFVIVLRRGQEDTLKRAATA